jgi:hypothetical protein
VRHLNTVLQAHVTELQSLFKALPVGVAIATDAACQSIRSNEGARVRSRQRQKCSCIYIAASFFISGSITADWLLWVISSYWRPPP